MISSDKVIVTELNTKGSMNLSLFEVTMDL